MLLNILVRKLLTALRHLDARLTDATYRHGRYCVADGKLRARTVTRSGVPAAGR